MLPIPFLLIVSTACTTRAFFWAKRRNEKPSPRAPNTRPVNSNDYGPTGDETIKRRKCRYVQ